MLGFAAALPVGSFKGLKLLLLAAAGAGCVKENLNVLLPLPLSAVLVTGAAKPVPKLLLLLPKGVDAAVGGVVNITVPTSLFATLLLAAGGMNGLVLLGAYGWKVLLVVQYNEDKYITMHNDKSIVVSIAVM
jgi:hypothetical protein